MGLTYVNSRSVRQRIALGGVSNVRRGTLLATSFYPKSNTIPQVLQKAPKLETWQLKKHAKKSTDKRRQVCRDAPQKMLQIYYKIIYFLFFGGKLPKKERVLSLRITTFRTSGRAREARTNETKGCKTDAGKWIQKYFTNGCQTEAKMVPKVHPKCATIAKWEPKERPKDEKGLKKMHPKHEWTKRRKNGSQGRAQCAWPIQGLNEAYKSY